MTVMQRFKVKVKSNKSVLGVVLRSAEPAFAELAACIGYDFIWIDMEHSVLSFRDVQLLISVVSGTECVPLVRVASQDPNDIGKALDIGAKIINVPHVDTADEAHRIVKSARYFPEGQRGFSSTSPSNRYGMIPTDEAYMREANDEILVMGQIESETAIQNIDDISKVEGLDILFFGPGDMSQSLGVPGQSKHQKMIDAYTAFQQAVCKSGKMGSTALNNPEKASDYISDGINILCCGVDSLLMRDAMEARLAMFREEDRK